MKIEKLLTKKNLLIISAFSICGLFFGNQLTQSYSQKQIGLYKANSGLGICQQRLIQSFTALMIKDLSSDYLGESFREMTSECLGEVSEMLSTLTTSQSIKNSVENLKSDTHWFYQKVDRVKELLSKEDIDLTESNIINKYGELEVLASDLENGILAESNFLENSQLMSNFISSLSVVCLILSFLAYSFRKRILKTERRSELRPMDFEDNEKLFSEIESRDLGNFGLSLQEYILDIKTQNEELENTLVMIQEGHNPVDENRYKIDLEILNGEHSEESIEPPKGTIVDFGSQFERVSARFRDKAENESVIIDMKVHDNFSIYADEEQIQQMIFSLANFGLDCSRTVPMGKMREINISSKPLGGIAYCKLEIHNYHFHDIEKNYLNGVSSDVDNISMNLILLKESLNELGLHFAIKNKQNTEKGYQVAEVEIVMERVEPKTELVSLIRGNKAQVSRMLSEAVEREEARS